VSLTKRVDLGEGRWAEVYTVRLHGVRVAMERLVRRSEDDDDPDYRGEAIRTLVTSWGGILSPADGSALDLSVEGMARARAQDIDAVYEAAMTAYKEARAAETGPPPLPPTSSD
jgi:hypothetical protein